MTNIKIAKTAGFCFGVDRGVKIVYDLIGKGKKVCTLGPIIHNNWVVDDLSSKGVRIVDSPKDVQKGETLVIRSHGVVPCVYEEISSMDIEMEDATCPFVKKIHDIVYEESKNGSIVLIAGDPEHPEVEGIKGYCNGKAYIFSSVKELEFLLLKHKNFVENNLILVAQTTFNLQLWKKCYDIVKKLCTNVKIFDTICNATSVRQEEAALLSDESDLIVVVGGRHSSNTRKLFDVCKNRCKTILIESASELYNYSFSPSPLNIGITAGASTPAHIIKEVHDIMSEKMNNVTDNNSEEMSFAELFEQSEQQAVYKVGKKVKGVVTAISKGEIQVDIGGKQSGFIPASEFSADLSVKPEDVVKKGDELDLIVTKISDQDGIVTLSKKRYDAEKGYEFIVEAKEEDKTLSGKITDSVRGGVLALVDSVKVFIPISQLSDKRVENVDDFIGKNVDFKIIEVNPSKRRAVASVRRLLNELKKQEAEKFWENLKVGDVYNGTVKSLTDYGAFVDLGGVDGMVHITELSWSKIKHPSEVVNLGDKVEVQVKDLDKEKHRISLSYRKSEENPWRIFTENYSVGQVVDAKIVSLTQFGAFAKIISGVDGLIHISQISNERINKVSDSLTVGQEVKVKIIDIDYDNKRISLSIRALLEDNRKQEEDENAKAVENIEGVEIQTTDKEDNVDSEINEVNEVNDHGEDDKANELTESDELTEPKESTEVDKEDMQQKSDLIEDEVKENS
ncbi:MAG: bifunctional 4-hydroxy-3-methylbut-2-enyl diphosphate reductase/30S ribosomal protein S1 [Oscillospiraceae bacterium]|nr:bifunctional 4-hydroxy-3-methylbut-2-enyl diphosphate reductase/30S ribosomal protein S1 [Oscillospiraceae bacterium]